MKTTHFDKRIWLLVFLLMPSVGAWAQSGKVISKQSSPSQLTAQPTQILARADKYKIVFPPLLDFAKVPLGAAKFRQGITVDLQNLVELMNQAGAQGYRLVSATRPNTVSLMKLDEGQYEYAFFEILNNFTRWQIDFNTPHDKLTRQGFKFVNFYSLYETCEVFNSHVTTARQCEYTNALFYEKERRGQTANKQLLVTASESAGKQVDAELTALVNEKLAANIYPIGILSPSEMLLEQVVSKDDLLSDKPEVRVIESKGASDDVLKRINALAQQGFRVWLAKNNVVVLYRRGSSAAAPVRYVWLEAKTKNFGKELPKLQAQGARYRAVYINDEDYWKNWLLFEVPSAADGKRREYKVLRFDFDFKETADNKQQQILTAASKETLATMNELVKEGFEARELFASDGKEYIVSLLLERESN